jgi:hypothetical protein
MKPHYAAVFSAIAMAGLVASLESPAIAAPPQSVAASAPAPASATHRSHASIRLTIGNASAWVGQAVPITVSAQFRDVEGVTLEGAPQLTSESVFTSNLSQEPRQSTVIVDGEPTLVATWTGTLTPSTAGPIALSVELPVRIRYRDAAPQRPALQDPLQGDPFAGMDDIDPANPASLQRIFRSFQQSFAQPFETALGRAHDDAITLKAASFPLEIKPVPASGQPPAFSGAVGRYEMQASIADGPVRASDPVTLRIVVRGDGDLDRVDLPGIATSSDWKAYPPTSKTEARVAGKRSGRKTFEQVLIALHGGNLTIPSIALSAFEPTAGRYTTIQTAPLAVTVEGAPAPSPSVESTAPAGITIAEPPPEDPAMNASPLPSPSSLVPAPRTVGLSLAPVLAALLAAVAVRLWRRRDAEKSLRRTLRRSAQGGSVAAFFDAARRLIIVHFAKRWRVAEAEVTVDALRGRLGPTADPLVTAISTADALRFGRRDPGPIDLPVVCSTILSSLREAT